MKIIGRFKRVAGAIGLIAAVALGASGCELLPGGAETGAARGYKAEHAELQQEWIAAYGEDREVATPVAKAGIEALAAMYEDFPQYTVHGFVPTDESIAEVTAVFRPISTEATIKRIESEFAKDKTLPVMTSYRTEINSEGVHGYAVTAPSGEKCTDATTPYKASVNQVYLTSSKDKVPGIIANVGVTVHCQEGYRLAMTMRTTFDLVQQDGKWLLADNYNADVSKEMPVQVIK